MFGRLGHPDFYRNNWILISVFILQIIFWQGTKDIHPELGIVPEVPTESTTKALSLGDEQFYFRVLGNNLQVSGDTFGRSTPLKDYDYSKLYQWFSLLDKLDSNSNYVASMAAYYYSNSQNKEDNRYVIKYLVEHSQHDLEKKWWWVVQAVMIAKYKLKDDKVALDTAYTLEKAKNVPLWARQMPAFVLAGMGENEQAARIVKDIIKDYETLTDREKNFINFFLKERLKIMIPELEEKLR